MAKKKMYQAYPETKNFDQAYPSDCHGWNKRDQDIVAAAEEVGCNEKMSSHNTQNAHDEGYMSWEHERNCNGFHHEAWCKRRRNSDVANENTNSR